MKKLAAFVIAGAAVTMVVAAFAPAAAVEKYTVKATLTEQHRGSAAQGRAAREGLVQRLVHREQVRRHADAGR